MENISFFLKKISLFIQNISLEDIWNFIISPPEEGILFYLKVVFIIISFILLGALIPLFLITSWVRYRYTKDIIEFVTYRPVGAKKAYKEWLKIVKKLSSTREADHKLAVIEADSLLEETLEKAGYTGELMEERLKKVDDIILSNKDQVLEAHKIRNRIVHEPDYHLTLDEAKKALEIFEEALRSLEAF